MSCDTCVETLKLVQSQTETALLASLALMSMQTTLSPVSESTVSLMSVRSFESELEERMSRSKLIERSPAFTGQSIPWKRMLPAPSGRWLHSRPCQGCRYRRLWSLCRCPNELAADPQSW